MTLLRAASRTLLASYFIASGVKAVRNPGALVAVAEPVADRVVPLVKQYAPTQVAAYFPEDTKSLVRLNGITQVLGGLALASGRGRRLGAVLLAVSLIPSTAAKHPFWTREDPEERALDKSHFLKNVSLLGGVLLAAGDTEGQPSLAWRASRGTQAIAKSTSKTSHQLAKKAGELTTGGNDFAEAALAGGAALVGTVVATSRRAAKRAKKEAAKAQVAAAKQAKAARKVAEMHSAKTVALATAAAKQAKKEEPKQRKEQERAARAQAKQLKADEKTARAQAKQAKVEEKDARSRAAKIGKNIERGRN